MVSQPLHEGAYNSVEEADMEISCCCAGPQANAPGEWKKPGNMEKRYFHQTRAVVLHPPYLTQYSTMCVCVGGGWGGGSV